MAAFVSVSPPHITVAADRFYLVREGSGVVSSKPPEAEKARQP